MGRFDYDSDEDRLPANFKRIGYDADTQTYTFEDTSTGRTYQSESGNRYGSLSPTTSPSSPTSDPHVCTRSSTIESKGPESLRTERHRRDSSLSQDIIEKVGEIMPAARKMLPFNVVKALQRFKSKKGKSVEVQEEKKDIVWV